MKNYVTITRVKNQKKILELRREDKKEVLGGLAASCYVLYGVINPPYGN
ncbi:MAG: hypothetical protein GY765_17440 [bacterium]|nr:hypothetical protein [bacterium]